MDRTDRGAGNLRPPVLLGVAGGSGSGKTTLARALAAALAPASVATISFDAYYRDRIAPGPDGNVNFDHPDALEADLLANHLAALWAGQAVAIPTYDFSTHRRRGETERVEPADFILVDGILLFAFPALAERFHGRIFVSAPEPVRFARRLHRDLRERGRTEACVQAQFAATVRPMHDRFVEPSRVLAHRVVSGLEPLEATVPGLVEWARRL